MSELFVQVISGLIVAVIAAWFGIGGAVRIVSHEGRSSKTGKWIIIISTLMIFGGLAWMGSTNPQSPKDWLNPPTVFGFTLAGYGFIFLIIGKIIAWFQRL